MNPTEIVGGLATPALSVVRKETLLPLKLEKLNFVSLDVELQLTLIVLRDSVASPRFACMTRVGLELLNVVRISLRLVCIFTQV